MVEAVAVFSEIPESDKGAIEFDEPRAIPANSGSAGRLRVAASSTHIYVTGNAPPGPWYRFRPGKRGLYRIPRTSVQSIQVIADRALSSTLLLWLVILADLRQHGPLGIGGWLAIGCLLLVGIASWLLARRFGLRLYTSDGSFYSVTETGFGRAKMGDGLAWASRVRNALQSGNWPVASH